MDLEPLINDLYVSFMSKSTHADAVALLKKHPELLHETSDYEDPWIVRAAYYGAYEACSLLLEMGADINEEGQDWFALEGAIGEGHLDIAKLLLKNGADPNLGRTLISAFLTEQPANQIPLAKLLIEHGVDVNQMFEMFGDASNQRTALDFSSSDEEFATLIRAAGGLTSQEIQAKQEKLGHPMKGDLTQDQTRQDVIKFFESLYGPAETNSVHEIVSSKPEIEIHIIKPQDTCNCVTLFTTGMSIAAMNAETGEEDYRYGELFIQLPATWPVTADKLRDANFGWPINWLRRIAQFPHLNELSLGPAVVLGNSSQEETLAENNQFTGMLTIAEKNFRRPDEQGIVQLYRLLPLFWNEMELEKNEGLVALLNKLDDHNTDFVVDMQRPSSCGF